MVLESIIWIALAGLGCGIVSGIVIPLVFRLMRKKKQIPGQYNTTFVFSGNLKQTSLLDAIQFLEIGRREGILHIYCGRRKGYLTFMKGQVVDAFYRNETGREAIFNDA